MPDLKRWNRTFERRPSANGNAEYQVMSAAAIDITNPSQRNYLTHVVATSQNLGQKAWEYYDAIGEVHYAVGRSARVAAYARLFCAEVDENGKVVREIENGLEAQIAQSLYSNTGGRRGLIDRYYGLMKVPADSYLIRTRDGDGDPDGFEFLSADELYSTSQDSLQMGQRPTGPLKWITVPGARGQIGQESAFGREIKPEDFLGRVWTPSRKFIDVPDTPLVALEEECEVLIALTRNMRSRVNSRFAMAGIFYIPTEIQEAKISGMSDSTAIRTEDILKYLSEAFKRNMQNRTSAEAMSPILLRGAGEASQWLQHITFDNEIFETDLKARDELIRRILFGLDVNQQATTGVGDSNHWASWSISDEERRIAVAPDLETLCWALTRLVLHKELMDSRMSPDQIMRRQIRFDLSDAAVRSNQQEDGRQMNDRGGINEAAMRRTAGFSDADAMEDKERVRWAGRIAKNPYLMLWGLPVHDEIDWEAAGVTKPPGPAAESPADDSEAGPGVGQPGSPDDNDSDTPREDRPA